MNDTGKEMGKMVLKKRWETAAWVFYSALSFGWLWFHEPWRDEAQAWLLVRDLNIFELLRQMATEGSPALWHLLIYPFVKSGLPYFSMFVLHWLISVAAAWLVLFQSPFSRIFRFAFVFSYLIIFEYVLIARNYNLTILLLFAIAWFYEARFSKPLVYSCLLFLLFNTNIHSFMAAAVLSFIYLWELIKSKNPGQIRILSFGIMALGGGLVFLQVPPGSSLQNHAVIGVSNFDLSAIFLATGNSFLPGLRMPSMTGMFFTFVLTSFLLRFIGKPKIFLFLLFSIGWLYFLFGSVRLGELRHHGLILILLVFSLWLEEHYHSASQPAFTRTLNIIKKSSAAILLVCLLISIYSGFRYYREEFRFSYSGSREAASFIKQNIEPDRLIIAHQSFACSAILPYLPDHLFWYADIQKFGTYIDWNEEFAVNAYSLKSEEVIQRGSDFYQNSVKSVEQQSDSHEEKNLKLEIYVLNFQLQQPESFNLELIFKNDRKVFFRKDETFYIYEKK